MLRPRFLSQSVRLLVLALLAAAPGFSANRIGGKNARIDSPLSEADVASIRALENWPNLSLSLENAVTPEAFASVAKLADIRSLSLDSPQYIRDLSPLASLPRLRRFEVRMLRKADKTPVSVAPLARCSELTYVSFHGTPVTDINALAACGKLRHASLYMANVDSLDFLASTPEMRVLDLYGDDHTFANYEPVSKLTKLHTLDIYLNRQATDQNLSVLKRLTSLRVMHMVNSRDATSLDFLENCTELEELRASGSKKLTDIRALARMPHLIEIHFSRVPLADISALADKIYLTKLNLSETKVADISALRGSAHLQRLELSGTVVRDITPLAGMRLMEVLDISRTSVADLAPLRGMSQLQLLNLNGSVVTDLTPLHDLRQLKRITLSRTVSEAQIEALRSALPTLEITILD